MPRITLIAAGDSGRLDKYIASNAPEQYSDVSLTRSKIKSHAVEILLNGKPAKLSTKIKDGDRVEIAWEEIPVEFESEDIPLDIIYEDSSVTVVNKAQGMVTHPAAGNFSGTLVNALLFHWGRGAAVETRPGIVHRLDKDTSGVIITAKTADASLWLTEQFASRRVKKEYIAIVTGRPPSAKGKIKTLIVRDPRNRKRFTAFQIEQSGELPRYGKTAVTLFHCVACYGPFSLMRLRIKTGRTHQIRVHMKHMGCPVLGDSLYGSKSKVFPEATLMLHARVLSLRLPAQEDFSVFTSPLPARFLAVISELRSRFERCVLK